MNVSNTVAKVGNEAITSDELEHAASPELARLDQQRQIVLRRKLDQLVQQRLLEREAKRRAVTVEKLLEKEVPPTLAGATDQVVDAFIAERHMQAPQGSKEAELRERVRNYLDLQNRNERRRQVR